MYGTTRYRTPAHEDTVTRPKAFGDSPDPYILCIGTTGQLVLDIRIFPDSFEIKACLFECYVAYSMIYM